MNMRAHDFIILNFFICVILAAALTGCSPTYRHYMPGKPELQITGMPLIEREFRAAWVASVANINWPSVPGLSTEEQKNEALKILDLLAANNFNAVILQVRPQCDALYQSDLEPWSFYLTGKQGRPPDPFYDPLSFWIEEAHQRGLELHAWLNPFRAHHPEGGEIGEASVITTHPEVAVRLANGTWWLDPGLPGTQDHSLAVALDIVKRYDIDGLHMDDYFYPYPSYNEGQEFPDEHSWEDYLAGGGRLSRADWRRENINTFVRHLYSAIKDLKPNVKFGISPFGIWRPHFPPSIRGFDQYDQLYADARLWLNEGWIDYWTPQLYWPVNQIPQSFPVLLGWWCEEDKKSRHIWPGINIGRREGAARVDETINQIMIARGMRPRDPGHVLWHEGILQSDTLLIRALLQGPYRRQALIPETTWLPDEVPVTPETESLTTGDSLTVSWKSGKPGLIANWVVYTRYGQRWNFKILGRYAENLTLPVTDRPGLFSPDSVHSISAGDSLQQIIITAVSRNGLVSSKRTAWLKGHKN